MDLINIMFRPIKISEGVQKLAQKCKSFKNFMVEAYADKFIKGDLGTGSMVGSTLVGEYFNNDLNEWLYITAEPNNPAAKNNYYTIEEFLQLKLKD